jgi:hypothetical protein
MHIKYYKGTPIIIVGVFLLVFWYFENNLLFLKKKDMGIIIDKENYLVVKTSYGYYTDIQNIDYPFSVEIPEVEGEQKTIEISWDDDIPRNIDDVEVEILEMY